MALPGGCSASGVVGTDATAGDNDGFVQEVLQSLFTQQDEHQELLDQTTCFQEYWVLQQRWNHYAHVNKLFRDKNNMIEQQHREEDEQERVQKLVKMHHERLLEEQADKEKKKRRAEELEPVQREWKEHRKEWDGVIESLDTCQEELHGKWAGRVVNAKRQKRSAVQNKEVLHKVLQRLQQRMAAKQGVGQPGMSREGAALVSSGNVAGGGESIGHDLPVEEAGLISHEGAGTEA